MNNVHVLWQSMGGNRRTVVYRREVTGVPSYLQAIAFAEQEKMEEGWRETCVMFLTREEARLMQTALGVLVQE